MLPLLLLGAFRAENWDSASKKRRGGGGGACNMGPIQTSNVTLHVPNLKPSVLAHLH